MGEWGRRLRGGARPTPTAAAVTTSPLIPNTTPAASRTFHIRPRRPNSTGISYHRFLLNGGGAVAYAPLPNAPVHDEQRTPRQRAVVLGSFGASGSLSGIRTELLQSQPVNGHHHEQQQRRLGLGRRATLDPSDEWRLRQHMRLLPVPDIHDDRDHGEQRQCYSTLSIPGTLPRTPAAPFTFHSLARRPKRQQQHYHRFATPAAREHWPISWVQALTGKGDHHESRWRRRTVE